MMLSAVRRTARSWAAGAILFLALVALVVTGFGTGGFGGLGTMSGGGAGTVLARSDGATLTEDELTDVINREFSQARQQQPTLSMAQFLAATFDPIFNQLVLALAVQAFGEDQGLVVSQRMVDREIVAIPAFRNFAGQFDENSFRQALASQNITEAKLREEIARSLMQRQLLGPIARGLEVPEGIARTYADLLLERRRGSIGVVPAEPFKAGISPTPQEVAAFYRENPARFTIPERRILQYAVIGPEQVSETSQVTAEEVAAYYQQNQASYGPKESRDLQQVVLPDQATAARFVQQVRGGTGFAAAAQQAGFSPDDIRLAGQTREQFAGATSDEIAAAAFAADEGALAGPIRSPLGFHVIRVEKVNRTPARPLEAVRDEITAVLRERKQAEALGALVTRVEDQLAEGASVEEVVREARLSLVTTPALTASGQVWGQAYQVPPELQTLLRPAFEMDPEENEPVVEQLEPNRRFALLSVERVLSAAPPPLAEIQEQVRETLIQVRALERARRAAHQLAERINGGTASAQAFAQVQPRIPAPEAIDMQRLDISRTGDQAPPPLITLFSLPEGRAHVLSAPNGAGWFVVHHAERIPGDASKQPQLIQTTRSEFSSNAPEEAAQQFARAIEQASEVERQPEAIAATRRRLMGDAVP